ncbi:membrane protein YczE [Streptomyces chrestomyceticus]|uniref:membrane protein YczE n=1 Tax=Streptomyces chrestomyceticus TaxID=68185 RepID=UPI0035A8C6D8
MFSTRRSGAVEGASDSEGDATSGRRADPKPGRRLPRRLVHLYSGLVLYGLSMGLQLRAGLGLEPWSVLNQGISRHTGLSIGTVTIVSGVLILLLWIPLRQRPGLGTVSNVVILGLVMDATLTLVPEITTLAVRIPLLAFAILLNGMATGLYISARFGPGPRDGLMTGLHRRTGRPLRLVRTCIEVAVLTVGFVLGGSVGVGTVLYALAIGPLAQFSLRFFTIGGQSGRVVASSEPAPASAPAPLS